MAKKPRGPRRPGGHRTTESEKETYKAKEGVGYCNPPVSGRIQPGERRSPGRPKGVPNFDTRVAKQLNTKITVNVPGRPPQTVTIYDAVVMKFVTGGVSNNVRAQRELREYILAREAIRTSRQEEALTAEEEEAFKASEVLMSKLLEKQKAETDQAASEQVKTGEKDE